MPSNWPVYFSIRLAWSTSLFLWCKLGPYMGGGGRTVLTLWKECESTLSVMRMGYVREYFHIPHAPLSSHIFYFFLSLPFSFFLSLISFFLFLLVTLFLKIPTYLCFYFLNCLRLVFSTTVAIMFFSSSYLFWWGHSAPCVPIDRYVTQ